MKRLLLIVGMHRSGTSCLTGLLGDAGVWLGPVETGSPHNVKGNNENRQVMNLNKAVLRENGGSWSEPPASVSWSSKSEDRADELLGELLAEGRVTAMKDPRSLLTGDGWSKAAHRAGADVDLVGTFRRPERVVSSLTARDPSLDPSVCLDLWHHYNVELLRLHEKQPFPLIDFDLPEDRYLASVIRAVADLGLDQSRELGFFEQGLRHHEANAQLDPTIEAVYARLASRRVEIDA